MKAWLLSVIGVVLLLSAAEMLLPEGKMRPAIRGVFAIVLMLVVLRPLPSLAALRWSGAGEGPSIDTVLLGALEERKRSALEADAETLLGSIGAANADVRLRTSDGSAVIGAEVSGAPDDATLRETIRRRLSEFLRIDENEVIFV